MERKPVADCHGAGCFCQIHKQSNIILKVEVDAELQGKATGAGLLKALSVMIQIIQMVLCFGKMKLGQLPLCTPF